VDPAAYPACCSDATNPSSTSTNRRDASLCSGGHARATASRTAANRSRWACSAWLSRHHTDTCSHAAREPSPATISHSRGTS